MGHIFVCTHGAARHDPRGCRRTYLSQRDLQAHFDHRHTPKGSTASAGASGVTVADLQKQNLPMPASQQQLSTGVTVSSAVAMAVRNQQSQQLSSSATPMLNLQTAPLAQPQIFPPGMNGRVSQPIRPSNLITIQLQGNDSLEPLNRVNLDPMTRATFHGPPPHLNRNSLTSRPPFLSREQRW